MEEQKSAKGAEEFASAATAALDFSALCQFRTSSHNKRANSPVSLQPQHQSLRVGAGAGPQVYKQSVVLKLIFPPPRELPSLPSPVSEQKTEKKQEDHCLGLPNFPTQ